MAVSIADVFSSDPRKRATAKGYALAGAGGGAPPQTEQEAYQLGMTNYQQNDPAKVFGRSGQTIAAVPPAAPAESQDDYFKLNQSHPVGRALKGIANVVMSPWRDEEVVVGANTAKPVAALNMLPSHKPMATPVQPLPSEAQLRQQPKSPSSATIIPSIADPNGYAIVDDKRVNYRDIGTGKDSLAGKAGASFMPMNDQRADSVALQNMAATGNAHGTVEVPMYGAGGRIIGWRSEIATPANTFNGQSIAAIAGDPNDPRYAENMGRVLQAQEQQRRGIADVETARYVADQGVAGHKLTADATVKAHELDATGREKAAIAKAANDQQVEFGKRVDWHLNNIKNLRMPKGFEGKHAEIAKDLAAADDPTKDVGIYYAPGQQNRMGIVTKKSVFDALLTKYQQQGYGDLDAYSLSVGDLKTIGQQKKTRLYRDIPNLEALTEREKKSSELTNIGA